MRKVASGTFTALYLLTSFFRTASSEGCFGSQPTRPVSWTRGSGSEEAERAALLIV